MGALQAWAITQPSTKRKHTKHGHKVWCTNGAVQNTRHMSLMSPKLKHSHRIAHSQSRRKAPGFVGARRHASYKPLLQHRMQQTVNQHNTAKPLVMLIHVDARPSRRHCFTAHTKVSAQPRHNLRGCCSTTGSAALGYAVCGNTPFLCPERHKP